jgi:Ca2+-binding RTX toxin-like protein
LAETGTASFVFSGPSDLYDVVLAYFDETDGVSHLEVHKQGALINAEDLDQNRGSRRANSHTLTRHTIATRLSINPGETFEIRGREDRGEPTRVDYIEFRPVIQRTINGTDAADLLEGNAKNNKINGFAGDDILIGRKGHDRLDGGDGIDTADYSKASRGIIAKLDKGIVLAPIYGTTIKPKIMPLGDSITAGQHRVDPTPGTYRIQLWDNFLVDGLSVDFVGGQSNGPSSLGDKDHEGHGGWTIDEITGLVNDGLIKTYQPDIVLLMIGTNSIRTGSVSEAYADLSKLIDEIVEQSPKTHILVSSVAPVDPLRGESRAKKTKQFNALIPDLVEDKVAQGKKVAFVNAGGSLTLKNLVSDGVHLNAVGYNKVGDKWYNAIVERDTLVSIDNITGTRFKDTLVGNASDNILEGGRSSDTLTGGGGADTFVYKRVGEGKDKITDFSFDDRFNISASGFGSGLVPGIGLSMTASPTGVFLSSETPAPISTSANFLYNTGTGDFSFDRDGTGSDAAVEIARLNGLPSVGLEQFRIVT